MAKNKTSRERREERARAVAKRPRAVEVIRLEEIGGTSRAIWLDEEGNQHTTSGSRGGAVMTALRLLWENKLEKFGTKASGNENGGNVVQGPWGKEKPNGENN